MSNTSSNNILKGMLPDFTGISQHVMRANKIVNLATPAIFELKDETAKAKVAFEEATLRYREAVNRETEKEEVVRREISNQKKLFNSIRNYYLFVEQFPDFLDVQTSESLPRLKVYACSTAPSFRSMGTARLFINSVIEINDVIEFSFTNPLIEDFSSQKFSIPIEWFNNPKEFQSRFVELRERANAIAHAESKWKSKLQRFFKLNGEDREEIILTNTGKAISASKLAKRRKVLNPSEMKDDMFPYHACYALMEYGRLYSQTSITDKDIFANFVKPLQEQVKNGTCPLSPETVEYRLKTFKSIMRSTL